MPGWLTNGLTVVTPATYTSAGQGGGNLPVDTNAANGQTPQTDAFPLTAFGQGTPALLTAAGSTQLGATLCTSFRNIVNVALTASTKGVRLPVAVTGMRIEIVNAATFGVKVYPATNGKIQAVATNGADGTVLAINKGNIYVADSATHWCVIRGA